MPTWDRGGPGVRFRNQSCSLAHSLGAAQRRGCTSTVAPAKPESGTAPASQRTN
jgi:hypothetical protein